MKQDKYRTFSLIALSILIVASLVIIIQQSLHLDSIVSFIPKQQAIIELLKFSNDTTKARAVKYEKYSDSLLARIFIDSVLISMKSDTITNLARKNKALKDTAADILTELKNITAKYNSAYAKLNLLKSDSIRLASAAEKYKTESALNKADYINQVGKEIRILGGIVYPYWANAGLNDSCQQYAALARRYADAAHILRDEEIYNDKNKKFLIECKKLSLIPESGASLLLALGYVELDGKALRKELLRNLPVAISISRLLIGINYEIEAEMRSVANRAS